MSASHLNNLLEIANNDILTEKKSQRVFIKDDIVDDLITPCSFFCKATFMLSAINSILYIYSTTPAPNLFNPYLRYGRSNS
jgi:hypothetical protein